MSKKKILYALIVVFSSFFIVFAFPKYTNAQTCNTGDGNGDGNVDGFDYVIWWQNFNQNVSGPQNGDFDCNGYVDGFDYVIWWQNFGSVIGTPTPGDRIRVTYSESNEDFASPERGFLRQRSIWPDQSGSISFSRGPNESLVWVYFRVDNYRNKAFDTAALNRINATFNAVRNANLKIIFTFTYNWDGPDAPLNIVLEHISQIAPILHQHPDVISTIHAGFVGKWGEWHGSSNNLTAPENQIAIINALLSALPQDRMIQLRYPPDKEIHFGGPMIEAQAFTGTDQARIGHHNLCVLADETDGGTYRSKNSTYCNNFPGSVIECWKDFISREGQFTPVGGETCQIGASDLPYVTCPNALYNFELMRYSYLNSDFYTPALNKLESGGCMPEIRRRLGYRLVLKEALIPRSIRPGGTINLDVTLTNKGFAAMFNARPVYLVLSGGGRRYDIPLTNIDPRRWGAGANSTMSVNVSVPSNVVAGTYKLGLWLPDAASSLRNNTAYAVRFANTNVWDASTGINFLTNSIQVQAKTAVLSKTTALTLSPKQILEKWLISTFDNNGDGKLDLLDVSLTF